MRRRAALLLFVLINACVSAGIDNLTHRCAYAIEAPPAERLRPRPLPIFQPKPVTSEAASIHSSAISADGQWLVYASARKEFTDLWLRSADPAVVVLPRQLTSDPANEFYPAFSPDGNKIAYVGTGYDVKGDIYLLDLQVPNSTPQRLTGREKEDGSPCFSPDGTKLYFYQISHQISHQKSNQSSSGKRGRQLSVMSLEDSTHTVTALPFDGDAAFPAVSPDGLSLAFVSRRDDPNGDILLLRLDTGKVTPLTQGPFIDSSPAWSSDGQSVYFSRISTDTNKDRLLSLKDNSVIYRVRPNDLVSAEHPITAASISAFSPLVAKAAVDARLLYLSTTGGTTNVWALPADGQVPGLNSAPEQLALARHLSLKQPPEPYLAILAFHRILERFATVEPEATLAAFELGDHYQQMGFANEALWAFNEISLKHAATQPQAALALVREAVLKTREQWGLSSSRRDQEAALNKGLSELDRIAASHADAGPFEARITVEKARLLLELGANPKHLLEALDSLENGWLGKILSGASGQGVANVDEKLAADAMILRGDIFAKIGLVSDVYPAYLAVLEKFAHLEQESDQAINRILDLALTGGEEKDLESRVQTLAKIASENAARVPLLSAGAINRIGDLYYKEGHWAQAKASYRQVLEQFSNLSRKRAAARLALAEVLYKEERFHDALGLYEQEIGDRPYEDDIYLLARAGYIRKSVEAAEYVFRLGEVASARSLFKDMLNYDPDIVEAHRGYIKCAAAQGDIQAVLTNYRGMLAQKPNNPALLYSTGLCLTYIEGKPSLMEARSLVEQAIAGQGQIPYFYQTLGYILEVEETVYGEKGRAEAALEAYQKAYFLTNQEINPANTANLVLNLGNGYFLLGQYRKAFDYYQKRLAGGVPFDNLQTEILFYRRLGACAFQVRESEASIDAYLKSLDLIEKRIAPLAASTAFDRISRYIMDHVVSSLMKDPAMSAKAKALAGRQSVINNKLADLTRAGGAAPPEPAWHKYRSGMEALIKEQERVNSDAISLAAAAKPAQPSQASSTSPNIHRQTFGYMVKETQEALNSPERLAQLHAEILDRLALAYHEAGKWQKALDTYESVSSENERLGLLQNLGRNRRSMGVSAYELAGEFTGAEKQRWLKKAAGHFEEGLKLIRAHGVVASKKDADSKYSEGLIHIETEVAIGAKEGAGGATEAAYGLSAQQEQRLAEAFLSRIRTELGELARAHEAVKQQLSLYPQSSVASNKQNKGETKGVLDRDRYGVSLLHHRAGHLAAARGNLNDAFDEFERSAIITSGPENAFSAATNVANMANVLTKNCSIQCVEGCDFEDKELSGHVRRLAVMDEMVTSLLAGTTTGRIKHEAASYHAAMGVHYAKLAACGFPSQAPAQAQNQIRRAVVRMKFLERAASHLSLGLSALDSLAKAGQPVLSGKDMDRKDIVLVAALHLNMAVLAHELKDDPAAEEHFSKALSLSKRSLSPELLWRALAGLGRLDEALFELKRVPLFHAGCEPGEILNIFAPLVSSLVEHGAAEDALNLTEEISELERVNQLAPLVRTWVSKNELAFCSRIYPRLERIRQLRDNLATAQGEPKQYLRKALEKERGLLTSSFGDRGKHIPGLVKLTQNTGLQESLMILLGLSARIEQAGDAAFAESTSSNVPADGADSKGLAYASLLETYHKTVKTFLEQMEPDGPIGLMGFWGPTPAAAVDIMERLPEAGQMLRLLPISNGWIVFSISSSSLSAKLVTSLSGLIVSDAPEASVTYLVNEKPTDLPYITGVTYGLSGTHFVRCAANQKPFKHAFLPIPPIREVPEPFKNIVLPDGFSGLQFLDALPAIHTLSMAGPAGAFETVPTRPGQRPQQEARLTLTGGGTDAGYEDMGISMTELSERLSTVSLLALPGAAPEDAYLLGQVSSMMGCPTLLVPRKIQETDQFVSRFINAYASNSAAQALVSATAQDGANSNAGQWMLLGHRGLSKDEASAMAQQRFESQVAQGQAVLNDKAAGQADGLAFLKALTLFENAIYTARQVAQYEQYLPTLYAYARESAYRAKRMDRALEHAVSLTQLIAKTQPDSEDHARALLALGVLQAQMERFDEAVPTLKQALDIIANLDLGPEQVTALAQMGVVLENSTAYESALAEFSEAATLSAQFKKPELLARQFVNIGRIYDLRLSQYAKAKLYYEKALASYRELKIPAAISQALLDVGRCCRLLGDFAQADRYYEEALALAKTLSDKGRLMAKILVEQANNAWFQARYQDAFALNLQAHKLAQAQGWALEQIISKNTAGLIWWTLGDNERALRELDQALIMAAQLTFRKDEAATTLNNIGLVYREKAEFEKALNFFDRALAIDRELKSRWAMAYDLRNKGLTLLAMGKPGEALPVMEEAASEALAIGDKINSSKALLGLGQVHIALAKKAPEGEKALWLEKASKDFDQALESARSTADQETQWRSLYGKAQLSLLEQKTQDARQSLESAISIIESMRADIKIEQLRDGFITNKLGVYETLVKLLADTGESLAALEVSERSRARNFIDILGNQHLSIGGVAAQKLYDRKKVIRARIHEQEALLAQVQDDAERKVYKGAIEELKDQEKDLMIEVQAQYPGLASLVSVQPMAASEIEGLLQPGVALISYYVLPQEILCWVIKHDGTTLVRTPVSRDMLEKTIMDLRRALQNLEPLEKESATLFKWLISPVLSNLSGVRTLGIVPYGLLHYLAFSTLFDGTDYLIDRYPLFYLPSASVLRYTQSRRTGEPKSERRVLAIGNPDLGEASLDLPFSEREVSTIRWNFPRVTILTRQNATEHWLKAHIQEFDIIHLASHGEFDPINPLLSAIKLVKDEKDDGDVKAEELFPLEIKADLVFLSACQTGLGKITKGDDVVGLNRAFVYAGTHTIISSLWRVDDVSTAAMVKYFYREYTKTGKAESLRMAVLHTKNQFPHPGYWGAFCLTGDYE